MKTKTQNLIPLKRKQNDQKGYEEKTFQMQKQITKETRKKKWKKNG